MASLVGECTLSIGGQVVVRAQGLLDAEYALFEIGDIELRASAPGSVREHCYRTTAEQALERLASAGVTREVVLACTQAMQPGLADAYARGPSVRRIARLLRAEELFEARTYDPAQHKYQGTFLDLTQLATDLGYGAAPTALQVVHLAASLLEVPSETEIELSTADYMKDRRPGERSFKRVSLEPVPELADTLKEHAQRTHQPRPSISGMPRHELMLVLDERTRSAKSPKAKERLAGLTMGADVSVAPSKGPLSDAALWEVELLLDDGHAERAIGRLDGIEAAQGRDPGTTYLRARAALLLESDAPKSIAERAAELSQSMGGFPEAELLAAEAWSRAGDLRRAGAFARDVADASDTPLLVREKARAIVDRVRAAGVSLTGLPPANRTTRAEPGSAPKPASMPAPKPAPAAANVPSARAPSAPPARAPSDPPPRMDLRTPSGAPRALDDLPPVLSLFGADELPFSKEPSGSPPRPSVAPTVRRPTGDMFAAPAKAPPTVSTAPLAIGKVPGAQSTPSGRPLVEARTSPNLWPDSRAEPDDSGLRAPGAPLVPKDLHSSRPPPPMHAPPQPMRHSDRPLLSSLPPPVRRTSEANMHAQPPVPSKPPQERRRHSNNSIPVSALPLAPLSMPRPSELPRDPGSESYMRGASLPAITIDPAPPPLPKAPLLPKQKGGVELAAELSLPPGLAAPANLTFDTVPRSVLEARIQFTMMTRELGRIYRGRGIELRMDLSGLEEVQRFLSDAYPHHSVRSPEEAYQLRMHGAFVGELLARTLDADWVDIDNDDLGHWVMLVPPDARVHPFGRVLRYVAMGSRERDLVSYYFELQTRKR